MKRTSKKLALHRDTVRAIDAILLEGARGGAYSGQFGSACASEPPNCNSGLYICHREG